MCGMGPVRSDLQGRVAYMAGAGAGCGILSDMDTLHIDTLYMDTLYMGIWTLISAKLPRC